MFGGGGRWLRFSQRFKFVLTSSLCRNPQSSSYCTSAKNNSNINSKNIITDERYRKLENLDMVEAAKMLFTEPPQKRKFGFDFHLVQFFFACMPSLAVYLVAQYARYDIRKMEVEVAQKRKLKEEEEEKEKAKEMELNPPEEKPDPQLKEVKVRLEKLEEAVKEIVVETKKQSSSNVAKSQTTDDGKKLQNSSAPRDTSSSSTSSRAVDEDRFSKHNSLKSKPELGEESKGSMATPNSSLQEPEGQNQSSGGAS